MDAEGDQVGLFEARGILDCKEFGGFLGGRGVSDLAKMEGRVEDVLGPFWCTGRELLKLC